MNFAGNRWRPWLQGSYCIVSWMIRVKFWLSMLARRIRAWKLKTKSVQAIENLEFLKRESERLKADFFSILWESSQKRYKYFSMEHWDCRKREVEKVIVARLPHRGLTRDLLSVYFSLILRWIFNPAMTRSISSFVFSENFVLTYQGLDGERVLNSVHVGVNWFSGDWNALITVCHVLANT